MKQKRHTCIVCDRKKVEDKMFKYRSHWACLTCASSGTEPQPAIDRGIKDPGMKLRVLNLYAGLGGNRKLWPGLIEVTAVEKNIKIAAAYKELYPEDILIVGDAHQYLLKNYWKYDIIWSSPPCQSHTRMMFTFDQGKKKFFDASLYQEIILLKHFFKGLWVVENVTPYYEPMISASHKIGRHLFWSNFRLKQCHVDQVPDFIELKNQEDKQTIMKWLDIYYDKNLYSTGHNQLQVFKNCVHPKIGRSIIDDAIDHLGKKSGILRPL